MYFFEANVAAANLIGYIIGIFLSYGLNRRWTFAHNEPAPHRLNRWILVAALAYGVNLGIVLAVHRIGKVDAYLAQPLGIIPTQFCCLSAVGTMFS